MNTVKKVIAVTKISFEAYRALKALGYTVIVVCRVKNGDPHIIC